jgi:hypothetical protein
MHILSNASTYCASILKQSSYFMQLSISPCLKSDYFQIIFIPERYRTQICAQLMQRFLCGPCTLCRLFIMWGDSHVSKHISSLLSIESHRLHYKLQCNDWTVHCCEKDVPTEQQSHWMKTALNKVLLIQINHKKFTSQLLKLYLF